MICRSLKALAPSFLSNILSRNSSLDTVKLRNFETDLRAPLFKTDNGQKSFSYRGAYPWKRLESEVKRTPSLYASIFMYFISIFF